MSRLDDGRWARWMALMLDKLRPEWAQEVKDLSKLPSDFWREEVKKRIKQ